MDVKKDGVPVPPTHTCPIPAVKHERQTSTPSIPNRGSSSNAPPNGYAVTVFQVKASTMWLCIQLLCTCEALRKHMPRCRPWWLHTIRAYLPILRVSECTTHNECKDRWPSWQQIIRVFVPTHPPGLAGQSVDLLYEPLGRHGSGKGASSGGWLGGDRLLCGEMLCKTSPSRTCNDFCSIDWSANLCFSSDLFRQACSLCHSLLSFWWSEGEGEGKSSQLKCQSLPCFFFFKANASSATALQCRHFFPPGRCVSSPEGLFSEFLSLSTRHTHSHTHTHTTPPPSQTPPAEWWRWMLLLNPPTVKQWKY